ncbi:MAG: carbohydrate-binding protein, partial [Candidatus Eisenbacteria bacterium]|nr:carbohydrate-binding protein [Candidatus Eisenbacteria bacterium]
SCITASFPQEFLVDYVRVYEDIPNALPTVSITAPAAGSTLPAGNITITATASDSDGSIATVEFYNGAAYLGEDTTAPYEFIWNSVPDGCYNIEARAIDNLGGTATDNVDITVGLGCGQLPYLGSAYVFPALIQAEDYDDGGDGVAYSDADAANQGGQYRPSEGVDIENCTDAGGGYNIGWLSPGEWTEYTVSVATAGTYDFEARVASQSTGGTFHLEFNGVDETGTVTVPVTGGWQSWTTVSFTATLSAGTQVMRFVVGSGSFNVNSFEVVGVPTSVPPGSTPQVTALRMASPNPFSPRTTIHYDLQVPANVDVSIFDARGRRVTTLLSDERLPAGSHRVVWDGRDANGNAVAGGVYFSKLNAGNRSSTLRMVLLK